MVLHWLCVLPLAAGFDQATKIFTLRTKFTSLRLLLLTTLTVCYSILVLMDDVNPFLMTISFAGLYVPTSSIFGLGLTWYAILNGSVLVCV